MTPAKQHRAPGDRSPAETGNAGRAGEIAYGPVPSRRLGRSLGVNNIPPKVCSYACAYCQVGSTGRREIERRAFYPPEEILRAVEQRLASVARAGEHVDYLSFVPDGEPTLDLNLGREIGLLKRLGLPIAVISNSSLLAVGETAEELAAADWVSLKADTVDEFAWRRLNRPHRSLDLEDIHEGMLAFREQFRGTLVTETMLVADVNDSPVHAADTASFLAALAPDVAYLSIPSRPPAASWVRIPDDAAMVRCHDQFADRLPSVQYLMGYEGDRFSAAGDPEDTLLGITAVHPMREDAVKGVLARSGADWSVVEQLLAAGTLSETRYLGHRYYLRRPGLRRTGPRQD